MTDDLNSDLALNLFVQQFMRFCKSCTHADSTESRSIDSDCLYSITQQHLLA